MHQRYEYLYCIEQHGRVTWANGDWTGTMTGTIPTEEELETCPAISDFLKERGTEGWELVSVAIAESAGVGLTKLFLKRTL